MAQKRKRKAEAPARQPAADATSPQTKTFTAARVIAIAVTFGTGLLALVYEVAWHRYLANFLGSQAQAAATILAVFLGGLCLGYLVFGRVSRSQTPRNTLLICGWSEIGIGVWVMLFPAMYRFIWNHGVVVAPGSWTSLFWETGLSALLMLFPTVLMGGTLPLLTQGLSRDLADSGPFHARVYAVNTAGAFIGCLLAGFYFLPAWGLTGTMQHLGIFNVIAGLILCIIGTQTASTTAAEKSQPAALVDNEGKLSLRNASILAFLAGFYSLTLQTIFIRLIGLSMGASEYAFCMVVAVFVSLLAMGAWCLSLSSGKPWRLWMNQSIVLLGTMAIYFSIELWPYSTHVIRTLFTSVEPNFYVYHGAMFCVLWLLLAIPVGAMGSTMPLLFGATRQDTARLGNVVGRLYAWNTVGCALGALIGGYGLLAYGNVDWIYRICLILMALSVALTVPRNRGWLPYAAVAVAAVVAHQLPDWDKFRMGTGLFRTRRATPVSYLGPEKFYQATFSGFRFLDYRDGPNTTVAISELDATPNSRELNRGANYVRNLKVNGKSDGETSYGDTRTMRMTAHLPVLFSKHKAEHVAVVGFGLGISVGSVSLYPEVKDIHVIELSPLVKQFAHYFDFANYDVTHNPKVRWSIGDAYRVLSATDERYDIIISEPSNPWVAGVERLFSKEYYEIVKRKLNPGAIYAQWIHDYTLSETSWGLVAKTFGGAFPHIRVFRTIRDTIMLGSEEPIDEESMQAFRTRYGELPEIREALGQVSVPDPAALLGLEIWVSKEQFPSAEVQTLEFPHLAHQAGFDFFMGEDLNLNDVMSSSARRLWAREYSRNAFIVPYLRQTANRIGAIESYTQAACDVEHPRMYPTWKQELKPCRDALVALAVLGRIEPRNGLDKDETAILARLMRSPGDDDLEEWKELSTNPDVSGIDTLLDLYGSFDSEFLPLSSKKVLQAAKRCVTGKTAAELQCRAHLVEVLAVNGHATKAAAIFASLLTDLADPAARGSVSQQRIATLVELLGESRRAEQLRPMLND